MKEGENQQLYLKLINILDFEIIHHPAHKKYNPKMAALFEGKANINILRRLIQELNL